MFDSNTRKNIRTATIALFIFHGISQVIFGMVMGGSTLLGVYQYLASTVMGAAAYEGGIGTALLGLGLHFIISLSVATVYFIAREKLAFMRDNSTLWVFLYTAAVALFNYYVVTPLTIIVPPVTPNLPEAMFIMVEHLITVALPLFYIVRREAK